MTRVVVLDTAPPASLFDEAAVLGRQVTAASMAALYNALAGTTATDPQAAIGWEEIYGSDQPLTSSDVPVMQNGICRIRYIAANSAFAVDAFQSGLGWVEEGRFTVWTDDNGTISQHGNLVDSDLIEWTPERAVLRVTTNTVTAGTTYRLETYITLQRGWTGPRVECYPSPNAAGNALGAHVRWSPYSALDPFQLVLPKASFTIYQSDVSAVWTVAPAYDDLATGATEPWAALVGGDRTVSIAVTRAADRIRRYDDVTAYGNTRKAFAVCADYGTTQAGYTSARFNVSPEARIVDAESYIVAGASRSVTNDAAASDGQAIAETQTNEAATMQLSNAQLQALGLKTGKFGVWVSARVTSVSGTTNLRAGFGGGGANTMAPLGGAVYSAVNPTKMWWWYLGEAVLADLTTATFVLNAWGVGGNSNIDRVMLVPHEQRTGTSPAYDGVRDQAAAHLLDTRNIPTLIART